MSSETRKIDTINIALMVFSFILACKWPFELFLFSYIILGPLHYMTEISWLRERKFFTQNNVWLTLLISLAILGGLVNIFASGEFFSPKIMNILNTLIPLTLLGGFAIGGISIYKNLSPWLAFGIFLLSLVVIYTFRLEYLVFLLVLLIPTLIHTTIFTGNFMLEGALKSKSTIGIISFLVFLVCNLAFFLLPITAKPLANPFVQNLFLESGFYRVNLNLNFLIYGTDGNTFVLDSNLGTRIQAFIAFAYTYHYLNWFSKTKVIKWYKIPKPWMFGSIGIWISSIVLHLVDIKLGITFIALLSTMHVYSEFPLNHRSFVNVFKMLMRKTGLAPDANTA